MKRSAGDKDGPEQKRLTTQQDGQAHRSATPLRTNYPQVPPSMPLSHVQKLQRIGCASAKTIWSGTLEILNGPHSNDQRQDVDIISGKIHSTPGRINTDNWPKQLKMTTIISLDDFKKLESLDVRTLSACIFTVDRDCKKMSHRAFIQYSSRPHMGCVALLEYSSSGIQVLSLTSWLLQGERCVGFIMKYSNNDHTVKLLTDLGILSHATVYNDPTKENARLKEELQQKDKMLVEQQMFHREEVEMLKTEMKEEKAMMEKEKDEMQREMDVMQNLILEKDRTICQKDSTISEKDESLKKKDEEIKKKNEKLQEKDEAIFEGESYLVEKDKELMEKDDRIMTINQDKEDLQRKNGEMQATLDALKQEFTCVICREMINKALTLKCGHSFCAECIVTLVIHRTERSTHHEEVHVHCPYCREQLDTIGPSIVIDSCIEKIKESRLGDRTEMESEGEPISEGSDDESSSASSPSSSGSSSGSSSQSSSGSSSSSFCRNPSSIENMFSPASSSDSD